MPPPENTAKKRVFRPAVVLSTLGVAALLLIILFVAWFHAHYSMNYVCMNCASFRHAEELRLFGTTLTLSSRVMESEATPALRPAQGGTCRHDWLFLQGCGGGAS
jgi:hypothetical protein